MEKMDLMFTEPDSLEIPEEEHGPLTGFSYVLTSHGMMLGSGSSRTRRIEWKPDGTVEMEDSYHGGGTSSVDRYLVTPELARKVADFVAETKLAALSQMEIRLPLVYDSFTSATVSMTFDDSGIGGSPYVRRSLECGASGMTFATLEDGISQMLKEIAETCECVFSEEKKTEDGSPFFPGLGPMIPGPAVFPASGQQAGNGPAKADAPEGKWVCSCGKADNTGRFCPECGSPRPAEDAEGSWTCPSCHNSGNTGKFCAACGTRRPSGEGDGTC